MNTSFTKKALASVFLFTLSWSVQGAVNLGDPLPLDPQVRIGKLENGLTYYIRKNGKPEKRVELRLVVKAGSILEDDDQQGLAHFTEHMAFDGTRHFKKHELISYLQSIGVKFGADLNAYTGFDETVYILPIPTDKPQNLETGFLVLEDWAQGVTMSDEGIDRERNVVLEEARMGKGAEDRMTRKLLPEVFNGSRYARRLPIGREAILKRFPYDAIRRFYADWYRPDLMAVIVVGDVEPDQVEALIRKHFAQLKNPAKERPRQYAEIPTRSQSNSLVITDKEATMNVVTIRYPIRKDTPELTISDYREDMVKMLYASMLGQRLQELTEQENPPFIAAYSGTAPIAPGYKSFMSSVYLGRGGARPAIAAVVAESERVRQYGFSASELDQAKRRMYRAFDTAYNERNKSESAAYVSEYVSNFLEQESMPGVTNEYAYVEELLPGVSLDEINQYARENTPSHTGKLVAYMGSSAEKRAIPSRAQLLNLVNAAEAAPVAARVEKAIAASLMARPPKAGGIVSDTRNSELGIEELTLSNGAKVILKPTDFKNDQILIGAARFGGQSVYDQNDMYSARYAESAVDSMGAGAFSPPDLSKILSGKSVSLSMNSEGYIDTISGSAGLGDLESLLQLLYLRMTSPRKDEGLFRAFISKSQDMAKDAMSNPESVFYDMVQTTLYNNHPRLRHVPKPEDFGHVDLARALAIYRERFGSARDLTFIIVGSFDAEKIKPLIAAYLASLPAEETVDHYKDLGIDPVAGVVKREIHIGIEPKSVVSITFTGPATYSPDENMRFQMLREIMNIRIMEILRQQLSLIYSGQIYGSIERVPVARYRMSANLPCGPENVDRVIAALFVEIEKMKKEGPLQSELDKVRQSWLEEYRIAVRTNSRWLASLKDSVLFKTDPAEILHEEERLNAITPDDIRQAATRYFNTENYVQAVLYPEKRAKMAGGQ